MAENEMTHKQKCEALIRRVQEKKRPLDDQRTEVWARLKALLDDIRPKEEELRGQIKQINPKVAELEELMASIGGCKSMKGATAERVLADLTADVEGL